MSVTCSGQWSISVKMIMISVVLPKPRTWRMGWVELIDNVVDLTLRKLSNVWGMKYVNEYWKILVLQYVDLHTLRRALLRFFIIRNSGCWWRSITSMKYNSMKAPIHVWNVYEGEANLRWIHSKIRNGSWHITHFTQSFISIQKRRRFWSNENLGGNKFCFK